MMRAATPSNGDGCAICTGPKMPNTTRDDLIAAGLDIVRDDGMQTVLPDFTVRELIDRAGGPTRSAFQHAWPQRADFEREVMEEVLAMRALAAPESNTSLPRAMDLMESGPDVPQFARYAYLNVAGPPQRRDFRDRLAVICLASSNSELAEFAAQSETARMAKADDLLVQVLRIAGMAFNLEPKDGFTFLDVARGVAALNDGLLLHRICNPRGRFDDFVFAGTPGWSLESVMALALVEHMTEPIGDGYTVPPSRKPHPMEASRPGKAVPKPQRPPTTRSLLVDAGVEIVEERGLFCALPPFTVPDLLANVGGEITEGAFHHSWPRKVDFGYELMVELVAPDSIRFDAGVADIERMPELREMGLESLSHIAADAVMSRPFDMSFAYVATLAEDGWLGQAVTDALQENFAARSASITAAFESTGAIFGRRPAAGLDYEQLAWITIAVTDGMLLRRICDPNANEPSLEHPDSSVTKSLLGFFYDAIYSRLTVPE